MECTSQETKASSQPNLGTSLSAFIDSITAQEHCFEQSLASQQLWSQQLADVQEARIKAAAQKTMVYAAEVNKIVVGGYSVASEVETEEYSSAMVCTSQETKASSQPNLGTSPSAFIDSIVAQEQCFEQSPASQQLWSQQLADVQEARIKAAAQKTTVYAAEVNKILVGGYSVASEVETEEYSSKRGNKEGEPQLQHPSRQFSRSKSRSISLFPYPEVHKEHRRYSPGDHGGNRNLGSFNSYTRYDDYKDRHRSSHRENICHSGDRRSHACRRSPTTERSWKREKRSPSYSQPQRYSQEDFHSPRSGSLRCQSSDNRGRNYHRVSRSPVYDSNPHHERTIDGRKHRERRGASSLETGRSHRRDILAEDQNNDHGDYSNEKISELTGTRSRCQSKQTMHGNRRNYATSETLKGKSNLEHHLPSALPLPLGDIAHSTKKDCWPTEKVRSGPQRTRKTEHGLDKGTNVCTKFSKTREIHLKDMIVKRKEVDETSLVNEAFDCRDAKKLLNDPTESRCYPLPEWKSKQQSEPWGRKELARKHHGTYEREESENDNDCPDSKLELGSQKENKKMKRHPC